MNTQQPRISRIMIQSCVRLDSLVAFWLLVRTREGQKKYPGLGAADIDLWTTGTVSPDGKTWKQYLEEGTLLIGVGGGPFDEHPSAEFGDRKAEGLSATTLVARDLGIDKSMLYRDLVKMVTDQDLKPAGKDSLGSTIKAMHRQGKSVESIIHWAFAAIEAIVDSQRLFVDALDIYDAAAPETRVELEGPQGQHYSMVLVRSDNPLVSAAARYRDNNLAVLVQVRDSGLVQIFGNQNLGVKLDAVAGVIRSTEHLRLNSNGAALPPIPGEQLRLPGQLPCMPQWCYQMPGENILNGSETAPNVPPTVLTPEDLRRIIVDNIRFVPVEGGGCRGGAPATRKHAATPAAA